MIASKLKAIFYELLPNAWILRSGPRHEKVIYLSFDDGPNPNYTSKLLDILNEKKVEASFFVTGDYINNNTELLNNIITDGHDVFNHSYSHWDFEELSSKRKMIDISKLDPLLPNPEDNKKIPFRPPCGKLDIMLFLRLIVTGRQVIYWSYDSMDYRQESEDFLLKRFMDKPVKNGDIILFHDDNDFTISVLPKLIDMWTKNGFRLQAIRRLIKN